MLGIHTFWSRPTLTGTTGHHLSKLENFDMNDFEFINFILSALMFKKYNGKVKLYTDSIFFNFLQIHKLEDIWDDIDTEKILEFEKLNISPEANWTSFKTYIIGIVEEPFVLMDHDLIVCKKIPEEFFDVEVRFGHLELLNKKVYPDKEDMEIDNFEFDPEWDWTLDIPNTCMLYFNTIKNFNKMYSELAIEFGKNNKPSDETLSKVQYLFADQRLLLMLIKKLNIKFGMFSNKCFTGDFNAVNPWIEVQNDINTANFIFEHTWVYKHTLVRDFKSRKKFMIRMSNMFKNQLPDYYSRFETYFKPYYD